MLSIAFAVEKKYNYVIYDLDGNILSKCMNTRSGVNSPMYRFSGCEDNKILVLSGQSFKYEDNTF